MGRRELRQAVRRRHDKLVAPVAPAAGNDEAPTFVHGYDGANRLIPVLGAHCLLDDLAYAKPRKPNMTLETEIARLEHELAGVRGALATERARTDELTRALDVRLLWLETKAGAPVSLADRLIAETVYSRRIGLRTATDD